jgi:2-methylisocitrate lyase-like PEP mutase family enzyme
MTTLTQKADAFRKLHDGPGAFVIANAWDAGSARLLENLGFKAIATTSAGLAFSLAKPDGTNAVSRWEAIENSRAIVDATSLPVSADLEGGYGSQPEDCAQTIREAAATGLMGGSIEDSTGDDGTPIYDIGLAVERVKAAAEAARASAHPFLLTARSENFLHGRADIKDTIRRLQAYQDAGADVLFAPGLVSADDIRAVTSSLDRPVNVVMGLKGVLFSVNDLSAMGVRRISVGGSLARAAYGAMLRGAKEILTEGGFTYSQQAIPHGEINEIFARSSQPLPQA